MSNTLFMFATRNYTYQIGATAGMTRDGTQVSEPMIEFRVIRATSRTPVSIITLSPRRLQVTGIFASSAIPLDPSKRGRVIEGLVSDPAGDECAFPEFVEATIKFPIRVDGHTNGVRVGDGMLTFLAHRNFVDLLKKVLEDGESIQKAIENFK